MPAADWELIKRSIARVTAQVNGEPFEGTAFYIGDGVALTALHVVADTTENPPVLPDSIELQFGDAPPIKAELADGCWDAAGDWAALTCDALPNVPALEAVTTVAQDSSWKAYGFPAIHDEGKTVDGTVKDPFARDEGARALELFCQDVVGQGAPLHGLSGAPCLIDGKVAGILRTTLTDAAFDGRGVRKLYTQAGAIYATPSAAVMSFQPSKKSSRLPEAWRLRSAGAKEFLIFLSGAEEQLEPAPVYSVAKTAQQTLSDVIEPPQPIKWSEAFASREVFLSTVGDLCKARVVVFDATGFEPAIMLLAGIRSVVRRGITILSVGQTYALGDSLGVPFNITDANIISHSDDQGERGTDPVTLLEERLRRGLKELELPTYLDNPVYDAIRRLPDDRRGAIPGVGGVLVLCPFEEDYNKLIWERRLRPAFEQQLKLLKNKDNKKYAGDQIGVARSFELNSARLVTQALYENIRRAQACVVDLTHWSPNVLYELGVRLASNRIGPSCLLAKNWEAPREELRAQCVQIESLFVDTDGHYDPSRSWRDDDAYKRAYGVDPVLSGRALSDGSVHRAISAALDVEAEPASRPVYRELIDSAAFFSKAQGDSEAVGLYPGNAALTEREEAAEFDRLLAAWLYLHFRPADAGRPHDNTEETEKRIRTALRARHSERIDTLSHAARPELRALLEHLSRSEQAAPIATDAGLKGLDDIAALKVQATALRKDGNFKGSLDILNGLLDRLAAAQRTADEETSHRIQREMADIHGMKGGVYRRYTTEKDHLDQAMAAYTAGCEIEQKLEHSTYNSSNVITLTITHEKKPLDAQRKKLLNSVITSLERDTKGERANQFYAWSDLAQFYLLRGEADRAREAYREALDRGPSADELKRHIEILRELADGMRASSAEIADSIAAAAKALEERGVPSGTD